jgi:hypothetical protein
MTMRHSALFLAMSFVVGCATAEREGGPAAKPALLMAHAPPSSDVTASRPAFKSVRFEIEPVPEDVRRDAVRMVEVRAWMELQIGRQLRNIPDDQYRGQVRPQLARELQTAGLSQGDVGAILRGIDYHRTL